MAPSTPTVSQRLEELEKAVGGLESKLTALVSLAVEKASYLRTNPQKHDNSDHCREQNHREERAVSYTHLTLPTIYSV